MDEQPQTEVVRSVIRAALDEAHELLPQDRRYANELAQRIAKDGVAITIAHALSAAGHLPFDASRPWSSANYHAVSYTMQRMRSRLLRHVRGGGRDAEAEREAVGAITLAFFRDLEERGWRLTRVTPAGGYEHFRPPGPCG